MAHSRKPKRKYGLMNSKERKEKLKDTIKSLEALSYDGLVEYYKKQLLELEAKEENGK